MWISRQVGDQKGPADNANRLSEFCKVLRCLVGYYVIYSDSSNILQLISVSRLTLELGSFWIGFSRLKLEITQDGCRTLPHSGSLCRAAAIISQDRGSHVFLRITHITMYHMYFYVSHVSDPILQSQLTFWSYILIYFLVFDHISS